jgi:hypothetical protein
LPDRDKGRWRRGRQGPPPSGRGLRFVWRLRQRPRLLPTHTNAHQAPTTPAMPAALQRYMLSGATNGAGGAGGSTGQHLEQWGSAIPLG